MSKSKAWFLYLRQKMNFIKLKIELENIKNQISLS